MECTVRIGAVGEFFLATSQFCAKGYYIPSTFKNPPFVARIFYRRALLQRLEIAD